jgi:hypothetical protein
VQKHPQPGEDAAEVVADGTEDNVGGVAGSAFEVAATEVTIGLHVPDCCLDGGAAPQFAFDAAGHTTLLAADEDATCALELVTAIALVHIGALDSAAGELLGSDKHGVEHVAVVRIAWQRRRVQHEHPASGAGIGGGDRGFDAELVRRAGLALADALDLGSMEGIKFPAALALLLRADLSGARQRPLKHRFKLHLAGDLAADVANAAASRARRKRNCRWWRLNCLAWA